MMKDLKSSGISAPKGLEHEKIDEVKRKLSLSFPSQELEKRFRVIVGARLSGVRKKEDFKAALQKPVEQGGLEFDEHTTMRVFEEVESHISGEQKTASTEKQQEKRRFVKKNQRKLSSNTEEISAEETSKDNSQQITQEKPQAPQSTIKPEVSAATITPQAPPGKKPMADVVYETKLVGPVEELRRMTLEDFRRLPGTTQEAIVSLQEDIDNLAKQDPTTRIQGIEAWRESPLIKIYQSLIATALKIGKPIVELLKDKEINTAGMTVEEFKAIRAFNATLRY